MLIESTIDFKLEQNDLSLLSYDGKPIYCDGKVTLSVECNERCLVSTFTFYECENGNSTTGIDLLDAVGFRIATNPVQSGR